MRIPAGVFAALAIASAQPAAAQEEGPRQFAPATDWTLDYGEDYCRLIRGFAHDGNELTLALERIQPGPVVRMMVTGEGLEAERAARTIGFRLLPEEGVREAMMLRARGQDGASFYNFGEVYIAPFASTRTREDQRNQRGRYSRSAEMRFGQDIEGILIESGVDQPALLRTGELGAALEALQICADELVTYWGLDAAQQRMATRPVVPANDMTGWLPSGTIGRQQVSLLYGAQNQVRLMVDAEGVPTDCAVHLPSLPPETNAQVCTALLENARFSPARDASGAPMASFWITQLVFLAQARR